MGIWENLNDLTTMSKLQKQSDPSRIPPDAFALETGIPIQPTVRQLQP